MSEEMMATPRPNQPRTSREAHTKNDPRKQQARIYQYLVRCGTNGATSDEVDAALFPDRGGAFRRFSEMRRLGMIEYLMDSRGKRFTRPTRTNRTAYVHVAIPVEQWKPIEVVAHDPCAEASRILTAFVEAVQKKDKDALREAYQRAKKVLA